MSEAIGVDGFGEMIVEAGSSGGFFVLVLSPASSGGPFFLLRPRSHPYGGKFTITVSPTITFAFCPGVNVTSGGMSGPLLRSGSSASQVNATV